jgi:hypothetical protein
MLQSALLTSDRFTGPGTYVRGECVATEVSLIAPQWRRGLRGVRSLVLVPAGRGEKKPRHQTYSVRRFRGKQLATGSRRWSWRGRGLLCGPCSRAIGLISRRYGAVVIVGERDYRLAVIGRQYRLNDRSPGPADALQTLAARHLPRCQAGAGLTQTQVADRLGHPQRFISRVERCLHWVTVVESIEFGTALGFDPAAALGRVAKVAKK